MLNGAPRFNDEGSMPNVDAPSGILPCLRGLEAAPWELPVDPLAAEIRAQRSRAVCASR